MKSHLGMLADNLDQLPSEAHASKRSQLSRWNSLWSPLDSRIVLVGITDEQGDIITDPLKMLQAQAGFWSQTFALKTVDLLLAERFIIRYGTKFFFPDSEILLPPTCTNYHLTLARAPSAMAGPDGTPYSCWKAAGHEGAVTLHGMGKSLADGDSTPSSFNDSLFFAPAKGSEPGDSKQVIRTPKTARPLMAKNTDNKTICSVYNFCITGQLTRYAHKAQSGFIKLRQGLWNRIAIDSVARMLDIKYHNISTPLLLLYDFFTAFPALAHGYIRLILKHSGLPKGFCNLVLAMYDDCQVYGTADGIMIWLFGVYAGVLQGCPLSGSLFALSVDPLLRYIDATLSPPELVRAFADDIATALASLQSLFTIHGIFVEFSKVSALQLNDVKCVIIPLSSSSAEVKRKHSAFS